MQKNVYILYSLCYTNAEIDRTEAICIGPNIHSKNKLTTTRNLRWNYCSKLHKSSTDKAKEIIDAMKEMELHVKTLRSEKDFLKSKKIEYDKDIINRKDKDEEMFSSIHKEKLQPKNKLLENDITILETHGGASDRSSHIQWNDQQEDDEYIPECTDHQMEFQYIQRHSDILNERLKKLMNQLVEANGNQNDVKDKYKQQLLELNDKLEEKEKQNKKLNDDIEKHKTNYKNLKEEQCKTVEKLHRISEKLRQLENQYDVRQNTIQDLKLERDKLKYQLEQKNRDYSLENQEMDTLTKKEMNELTDMRLIIEKLENDEETTEKNVTKERQILQTKIIELQGKEKYSTDQIADDVKGALHGIEANSDVALVVLHSKEIKKPSEKILTEPDFKKLGIIVDINFVTAKGIISDDVTDKAIHQLVGFINKF
ncbi:unnamed protein product [Mytilus coruscus]|uniref:Uncharacterized protein n=1 Tax=Mytilus coruscus TaxID=42192 RepID=A0A6J8AU87_MYTCO|nr:unnamed protein product [Mytilus coruscus]